MTTLRIEEDKQFLLAQRHPGRVGCLGAVDKIYAIAEEKREKRKRDENTRLEQHIASKIAKNSIDALPQMFSEESEDEEEPDCAQIVTVSQGVSGGRRARKHFITPKLVAVLDRCQVSVRYAVFIMQATADALGHSLDELIITATSNHKVHSQLRALRAAEIKSNILKSLPQFVVVHWDGKLLPALRTMICCYLLYSGLHASAEDALACYDEKRTKDRKGVTIPSQRRYVQYFAKLIQCGLKYERTTLQLCEIRFADANALHSQGTVNCSISVLQDTSSVKVQTLQTHIIDFRKNCILEINNPSLSISGDIKVELTQKTSRKKIFHFWFNTYFVCDAADIESDGKCRKLVYTLHKNEIDDAHKDKEHKSFSEDFKVQIVLQPANPAETIKTGINIVQRIEKKNHQSEAQDTSVQYNSKVPENSRHSSDLNNTCHQKSTNSCSPCSNKNMCVLNGLEENNFCGNLKVFYTVISSNKSNHCRRKTSIILSFQRQCSTPPPLRRIVEIFNTTIPHHKETYNQIDFENVRISYHQCQKQKQQQRAIQSYLKSLKDIRSKYTGSCLKKHANKNSSIQKKCSSNSKIQSFLLVAVDRKGVEFCKSYLQDFLLMSLNCPYKFKLKTHFSLNACKILSSSIELNILYKNDNRKTVFKDYKISFYDFKKLCCSIKEIIHLLYFCAFDMEVKNSIIYKQNQLVFKLQSLIAFNATNTKNSLIKRHSHNARNEDPPISQKLSDCESSSFPVYVLICSYKDFSSIAITARKKIKFKLKKYNTKFPQKYGWLHRSYLYNSMVLFKTFFHQTTFKRKSIAIRFQNCLSRKSDPLAFLTKLSSLSPLDSLAKQSNLISFAIRMKPFGSNLKYPKYALFNFVLNFNSFIRDEQIKVYSFFLKSFIQLVQYLTIQRSQDETNNVSRGNTIFKVAIPIITKNIELIFPIAVPKVAYTSYSFPIRNTSGLKHIITFYNSPISEVNFKSHALPFKFYKMKNLSDNKEILKISPVTLRNNKKFKKTNGDVLKLIIADKETAILKDIDNHLVPVDDSSL